MKNTVAVLYARVDSHYKSLPCTDVWDIERDARKWPGGAPVVAHPPCRMWGRLKHFAKPRPDEHQLAITAVQNVRQFGGVLEHPAGSTLWSHCDLPRPGEFPDAYGGWTLEIQQFHWGHRAEKSTWLYIVGCEINDLPPMPKREGGPTHCVSTSKTYVGFPAISKAEREHTPPALAIWLVELAQKCRTKFLHDNPVMKDILDIEGWKLLGTRVEKGERKDTLVYEAEYLHNPIGCTKCGSVEYYRHGIKKVKFTDSPLRGMHARLEAQAKRYKCRDKDCGETFMQPLGGVLESPRMTERCAKFISDICLDHTFVHVANEVGIDEKTVRTLGQKKAAKVVTDHKLRLPRVLGIDETRIAKVLRVVFTDIEGRKLLDMQDGREKTVVEAWFRQFSDRDCVQVITMDMWKPYERLARKYFPKATVVVDKFHIVRMASAAMDKVRIRLAKGKEHAESVSWKRRKHVLHRPYEKLSPSQKFNRDTWLDNEPEMRHAFEAKEAFYAIYQLPKLEAIKAFDAYDGNLHPSIKSDFRPLLTAMKNWRKEILAYFDQPYTNAFTESLNNLIKRIVKDGRGYSYSVLRARILAQYGDEQKEPLRIKYLIKDHNNPCGNCGCLCSAVDMTPVVLPPLIKGQRAKDALVCPECAERFHT